MKLRRPQPLRRLSTNERGSYREGEKEQELVVTLKQLSNERNDRVREEHETDTSTADKVTVYERS